MAWARVTAGENDDDKTIEKNNWSANLCWMTIVDERAHEIAAACERFRVRRLYVFGSILSEEFSATSDVDFTVEFGAGYAEGSFVQYFGFKEMLESILGRPVDLVCYSAIRNPIFRSEIDREKKLMYAA
ncbi:MAG: nucleotidyltransferase family protein [Puniceicoccales bacterium]